MKRFAALLSVFICLHLWFVPAFAQTNQKFRPSEKAYKWADKQLKKMTADEKIGQLVHIGINARYMNQASPEFLELKRQIVENKIGGIVVFVGGVYETVHLVNRMQAEAKIPLLISADFETGVGMRFEETVNLPWNMAIAATGNPDLARRQGEITALEARALGVQQVFAPVVDVNNNADNPVINVRSYGEHPEDVARFATAFTMGLQSRNVLATAKHFPGHGDTAVDSHRGLPIINFSRERLEKIELVPFRSIVGAGVGSVMVAHIGLPLIDFFRGLTSVASICGKPICATIIEPMPASTIERNGTSSTFSNRSREKFIIGKPRCESTAVSPCPGKCFAVAKTFPDCKPCVKAAAKRPTSSGFSP